LPTLNSLRGLFADVRRRRVIRVLAIYAVAGWIVIQIAATVLPGLNVPDWSVTLVIVLVALGLPLAAVCRVGRRRRSARVALIQRTAAAVRERREASVAPLHRRVWA
jgi:hypothetical protein